MLKSCVGAKKSLRIKAPWSFINPHIERNLIEIDAKHTRPKYIGRKSAAAPATGLASTHKKEQIMLVDQALTLKG